MSTHWDLHCVDHDEPMGADWNHGDQRLARAWRMRDKLRALAELLNEGVLDVSGDGWHELRGTHVHWLVKHAACHVDLLSEYRDRVNVDTMEPLPPKHCQTCVCEPRP